MSSERMIFNPFIDLYEKLGTADRWFRTAITLSHLILILSCMLVIQLIGVYEFFTIQALLPISGGIFFLGFISALYYSESKFCLVNIVIIRFSSLLSLIAIYVVYMGIITGISYYYPDLNIDRLLVMQEVFIIILPIIFILVFRKMSFLAFVSIFLSLIMFLIQLTNNYSSEISSLVELLFKFLEALINIVLATHFHGGF